MLGDCINTKGLILCKIQSFLTMICLYPVSEISKANPLLLLLAKLSRSDDVKRVLIPHRYHFQITEHPQLGVAL